MTDSPPMGTAQLNTALPGRTRRHQADSHADVAPRNGVWTMPAADPADDPHAVTLGQWLGCRRADGSEVVELLVSFSSGVGILTPDEARTFAAVLVAAADYADACQFGGGHD